jgi:hypothetical protein
MEGCPFYQEEINKSRSREIRPDGQAAPIQVTRASWCSHKHSSVSEFAAVKCMGGGNLLECGGSLVDCVIPVQVRGDIE